MISVHFQGKPFSIKVIQIYAPTSNAEEAEVEQFYEDLLELTPQKDVLFIIGVAAAAAKSLQSCPTLCDPIDGSPPGSTIPSILQARTRSRLPFPVQCMKVKSESEVPQSCPTLHNPLDCSLPGSSIDGIFQPRVLERIAIAFSTV